MSGFEMSPTAYLWVKWLHYLGFISWMAALFYLPRLFVYHAENIACEEFCRVVKKQERLLHYFINWVAFGVSALTGVAIILWGSKDLMAMGYFHVKLLCVVILFGFHLLLGHYYKQLRDGKCTRDGRFFRLLNEVPTLVMFVIIWAMIVKPYA